MTYLDIYLNHQRSKWKSMKPLSELEEIVYDQSKKNWHTRRMYKFDDNNEMVERIEFSDSKLTAISGISFSYSKGVCDEITSWIISNNMLTLNEKITLRREILVKKENENEVWEIYRLKDRGMALAQKVFTHYNEYDRSLSIKTFNDKDEFNRIKIYYYNKQDLLIRTHETKSNMDSVITEMEYTKSYYQISQTVSVYKGGELNNKKTYSYLDITKPIGDRWYSKTNIENGVTKSIVKEKYTYKENRSIIFNALLKYRKRNVKKRISQTIKIILTIYLLIVLYLHALNGRYYVKDRYVYDKWKKEMYISGSDKFPLNYKK